MQWWSTASFAETKPIPHEARAFRRGASRASRFVVGGAESVGTKAVSLFVPNRAYVTAIVAWPFVVAAAFGVLVASKSASGPPSAAPHEWPAASSVQRTAGRWTLVMNAHPRCACTRASIRELERLMARIHRRADAVVVFAGGVPAGAGDLHAAARAIPGVRVVDDVGNKEAKRFGAATSGAVLLYDPAGQLVFQGGLTLARGHEGDSAGAAAIRARVLRNETNGATESNVFGCALIARGKQ